MEAVRKLELTLEAQYKKLPHLPENVRKWFAENAWWLVIIGVTLGVISILGILSLVGLAIIGLSVGGFALGAVAGAAIGATVGGIILVTTIISLAVFIVETVLMAMAISPLKESRKRGWDLLFFVMIVNTVSILVVGILTLDVFGLFWSLLWVALAGYFLYEVRDYFLVKKVVSEKKPEVAEAETKA